MNSHIFAQALTAWNHAAPRRAMRQRMKNYTYGRQWGDTTTDSTGHRIDELELMRRNGLRPMTNNLLRPLIKSIIGRFRHNNPTPHTQPLQQIHQTNHLNELDARMLEEFLISGCAIQRITPGIRDNGPGIWIDNINPDHFFCNPFTDPRATDINLLGTLHQLTYPQLLLRHGHSDPTQQKHLRKTYSNLHDPSPLNTPTPTAPTFHYPDTPGLCRVIEVWTRDITPHPNHPSHLQSQWHGRFFAPDGTLIDSTGPLTQNGSHPFAIKFYPLTDGEIHPFIEDVIDQQRHINRLITLIDQIMSVSAKGVLLLPEEAIASGQTLNDIIQAWNRPGGVIPIAAGAANLPRQISSDTGINGASALLDLEMKLFRQISGVSEALQGQQTPNHTSATLYDSQITNSTIALLDIYGAYQSFLTARDNLITSTAQTYSVNKN